jgi:hypothetical protein
VGPEDWRNSYVLVVVGSLVELSSHGAVQEYTRQQPGLHRQIRELSTAVKQTGVRVLGAGLLKKWDDFDLKVYTPDEIWMFDLAYDVVAMLDGADTPPERRRRVAGRE